MDDPTNAPQPTALRPTVFLDRDGTLNREVEFAHRPEDLEWIKGAPEAIHRLNERGILAIVVTNQSGVARGLYDEEAVDQFHAHMQQQLRAHDARIDAFYHAPFHPDGIIEHYRVDSPMRKPGTGMFELAMREYPVDPHRSFLVGDRESDITAGQALDLTTFLVETGYGETARHTTRADHVTRDVGAAVDIILELIGHRSADAD